MLHRLIATTLTLTCLTISLPSWAADKAPTTPIIMTTDETTEASAMTFLMAADPSSPEANYKLYLQTKKEAFYPMLLNILPFGFGSYSQGDNVGGIVLTTLDTLSIGTMVFPWVTGFGTGGGGWGAFMIMSYGFIALMIGRVGGMIWPHVYANLYNQDLQKQLQLTPEAIHQFERNSLSAAPTTLPLFSYNTTF